MSDQMMICDKAAKCSPLGLCTHWRVHRHTRACDVECGIGGHCVEHNSEIDQLKKTLKDVVDIKNMYYEKWQAAEKLSEERRAMLEYHQFEWIGDTYRCPECGIEEQHAQDCELARLAKPGGDSSDDGIRRDKA